MNLNITQKMVKEANREASKTYADRWAVLWFWIKFVAIWILGGLGIISNSVVSGAMFALGWGLVIPSFVIALALCILMEVIMGTSVLKISWDIMTGNITKKGFLWANGSSLFIVMLMLNASVYLSLQWDKVFEFFSLKEKERKEMEFNTAAIDAKYDNRLADLRSQKEKDLAIIQSDIDHYTSLQDKGYITIAKAPLESAQQSKSRTVANYLIKEKDIQKEREAEKRNAMREKSEFNQWWSENAKRSSAIVVGINVGIVGLRIVLLLVVGVGSFYLAETDVSENETAQETDAPGPVYQLVSNEASPRETPVSTRVLTPEEVKETTKRINSLYGTIRKYRSRMNRAPIEIRKLEQELVSETDEAKRKRIESKIETQQSYIADNPQKISEIEAEIRELMQKI